MRSVSEGVGYSDRRTKIIRIPSILEIRQAYDNLGLETDHLFRNGILTDIGQKLLDYFKHRATILNTYVAPRLMDVERAREEFERLHDELNPKCPIPMNKQRDKKKAPAYLTGIVNMIVEANSRGYACDYDPKRLTKITRQGAPLRTLSRRVDGAFPSITNPVVLWEIKEYYYTTTFGSRVADGIYETLLDGMELEELSINEGIIVRHLLMVDSRYTWWECGRSYLCRLIDMIHMGFVDEILFGYETIERLPQLVTEWVRELEART